MFSDFTLRVPKEVVMIICRNLFTDTLFFAPLLSKYSLINIVMLTKFAVKNYRGFKNRIEWDLSHPSNYTFNNDAVRIFIYEYMN